MRIGCWTGRARWPTLGVYFGADLYAREVDYMIEREWARTGEDILYRRTKAGLHLTASEREVAVELRCAGESQRTDRTCDNLTMSINVVILAAGQGKRMQSAMPKVLHPLAGVRPCLRT